MLKLILKLRSIESAFDSLKIVAGATEMVQQSRALVALTDDQCLVPNLHIVYQL